MIKNERQYRITRAQAEKFEMALAEVQKLTPSAAIPFLLQQAQRDALET